jgi:hypothetical protein
VGQGYRPVEDGEALRKTPVSLPILRLVQSLHGHAIRAGVLDGPVGRTWKHAQAKRHGGIGVKGDAIV